MLPAKTDWAGQWLRELQKQQQGKTSGVVNPATGEALVHVSEHGEAEVSRAVDSAHAGMRLWLGLTRAQRAKALRRAGELIRTHHAELATLETLQNGKTYRESFADDVPESADVFDYYAGWIDKIYGETSPVESGFLNFTKREPVGVCALVVPWNFPLLLACWKIAPALAMGNSVIVKPSPFTPLTVLRLAQLFEADATFPPGVFNVVTGGAECGRALGLHAGIAKISFTGSTDIGKQIVQASGASNLKLVSLELGGKSPNILFPDAPNLEETLSRAFVAMFSHKGEKCSEPTRLIVHKSILPQTLEALCEKAAAVKCGDPFAATTDQGPQCHTEHFRKILNYIEIGKKEGATLIAGGAADVSGDNARGLFIRPTVFSDVKPNHRIAREEIFGPVLSVLSFSTEDEAVTLANDSAFGLAAGLYTADLSRAHRLADRLDAGQVFINHYGCYDFAAPFGGFKESGWGKEMARHSLDAYTRTKSVWIKY